MFINWSLIQINLNNCLSFFYLNLKCVKDSTTPTFAQFVLYSKDERWAGVPIIFSAGKMLNEKTVTARIQFKSTGQQKCADFYNNDESNRDP